MFCFHSQVPTVTGADGPLSLLSVQTDLWLSLHLYVDKKQFRVSSARASTDPTNYCVLPFTPTPQNVGTRSAVVCGFLVPVQLCI